MDIRRAVQERQALDVPKWQGLSPYDTTEVVCPHCAKTGICMVCHEVASVSPVETGPQIPQESEVPTIDGQGKEQDPENEQQLVTKTKDKRQLLFRCRTCKRLAHYDHLENPFIEESTIVEIARAYQEEKGWLCNDCFSFPSTIDKIIAWRPYPPDAKEANPDEPYYRDTLPREYLVKWAGRSYRRTSWVPHLWLLAKAQPKLKNFLDGKGPKVQLEYTRIIRSKEGEEGVRHRAYVEDDGDPRPPVALPNAEDCIPEAWLRVDRVLDVRLWTSRKKKLPPANKGRGGRRVISSDDDGSGEGEITESDLVAQKQRETAYRLGDEPSEEYLETVDEWVARTNQKFKAESIDQVIWCFFKWEDQDYTEGGYLTLYL
jgi:chromodomain-helicase-DNA-binding protein 4